MAIRVLHKQLGEAELNAPDLDEDGNLDVEHYIIPTGSDIADPYLKEVWTEALAQIDAEHVKPDSPASP